MKKGKWTIVVPDKRIIKQYDEGQNQGIGYVIENNDFWISNLSSNIHAIQYTGIDSDFDQVEFNDGSPNSVFKGDINIFAEAWDKEHLLNLQLIWDNNNVYKNTIENNENILVKETIEEKITRIGERPKNYNSINII
jgi:hypothetical protein